ncbi:MAG: UDP-N-acetylmuramate--L-alanine ligase [Clostridia bacterium]|nr:UDP-N-acetylmuramate--L-alanine ligase [Clostridia bacterium]
MEHTEKSIIMHSIEQLEALLPKDRRLFFIGIGGVSMSALAMIAKEQGYTVGGSDRAVSHNTEMLRDAGITVFDSHDESHIKGYDAIIYNAAIGEENPEYKAAKEAGLPLIYRSCFLSFLMRGYKHGIGVAGMHGKTTTSAMLSHLFLYANRDPAILIGAELPEIGHDFRSGSGDDFIFEACEYKDSFLSFHPSVAVVLNEEMDHPDYFKSLAQIRDSFHRYMQIPGEGGCDIINCDDENVLESAKGVSARRITFGIQNPDADYRACDISFSDDGCGRFTVYKKDAEHSSVPFCHIALSVSGMHNVSNALACAAAADVCGIDADTIASGLSSFTGAGRRMEYKGHLRDCAVKVPVYDDFGHHPSEIKTTLEGARRMHCRRLRCVYQPHTYSRTAGLFDAFCTAFDACDEVIFVDIYAARETNTFGVSSEQLAAKIPHAAYDPDLAHLYSYLKESSQEGDLLVIMGAGDIAKFAEQIAEK